MPKRSYEEKLEHYNKKIEELQERERQKRRRHLPSSSDDEDDSSLYVGDPPPYEEEYIITEVALDDELPDVIEVINPEPNQSAPSTSQMLPEMAPPRIPSPAPLPQDPSPATPPPPPPPALAEIQVATPNPTPLAADVASPAFLPLNAEMLSALGEATDDGPSFGDSIHDNLAQLWNPLLLKGMTKEVRDKALKDYIVPSNCTLLQAPKLNIEIASSPISEMVKIRDKKVEIAQQQLGLGITAVSRAMTLLLTENNKVEAVKILSDGCRILCDLHCTETRARIKMITPGLTKTFLNVIQDSKRDETLFGANLSEKIRASRTIEQQGLQIRRPAPVPRTTNNPAPSTSSAVVVARPQFQGNYQGPPRFATNRGGRGGTRRYIPSSANLRRPPPPMPHAQRAGQGRPRAQPRH